LSRQQDAKTENNDIFSSDRWEKADIMLLWAVIFFKKESFQFNYTECPIIHIMKRKLK